MNEYTLDSLYRVQAEIYKLFAGCSLTETAANTINPAQQQAFLPLKVWRVDLGGCFAEVRVLQRFLTGCFAEMLIY